MTYLRYLSVCAPLALLLVALMLHSSTSPAASENSSVAPIEFVPEGAAKPEDAATSLFLACSTKSPKHFTQNLLLGVCDGPIDTLNKYAKSLHTTTYSNGKSAFTVYELPKRMKKETIRVVASQAFTKEDVDSLRLQFMSTYYCEQFIMCFEVAADNYDGNEYRTRIVVAMVKDRWYAIPRCRSSRSFYQIAAAKRFTVP